MRGTSASSYTIYMHMRIYKSNIRSESSYFCSLWTLMVNPRDRTSVYFNLRWMMVFSAPRHLCWTMSGINIQQGSAVLPLLLRLSLFKWKREIFLKQCAHRNPTNLTPSHPHSFPHQPGSLVVSDRPEGKYTTRRTWQGRSLSVSWIRSARVLVKNTYDFYIR